MIKARKLYQRLLMLLCVAIMQKTALAQPANREKDPPQKISLDSCNVKLDDVMRVLAPFFLYMLSDNELGNLRRDVHINNLSRSEALLYLEKRYSVRFDFKNHQHVIKPYELRINGYTCDSEGNALPGVNIVNLNNDKADVSNSRGYFSVGAPYGSGIVFSFAGKKPKEFVIRQDTFLQVFLPDSCHELDAVIVEPRINLGHVWIAAKTASGSFRQADMAAVQRHPGNNIIDQLASETGLSVQFADVLRGKLPVAIRGKNTLYGDPYTLIVRDGLPQPWNMAHFDSFNVDSASLSKDAAGSSLWGARAGNGAIVLQTKKGAYKKELQCSFLQRTSIAEKPDIRYQEGPNAASFIQWEKDNFDRLTTKEASGYSLVQDLLYKRYKNQVSANQLTAGLQFLSRQDIRRDISQQLHQPGSQQQYAASFSNGAPYFRYYASALTDILYLNEKVNSQRHRDALFNASFRNKRHFEINISTHFSELQSRQNALRLGPLQPYLSFRDSSGLPAWIPYKYPIDVIESLSGNHFYDWHYYPALEAKLTDDRVQDLLLQGSVQLYYAVSKWLRANLVYQYTFTQYDRNVVHGAESFFSLDFVNRFRQNQASGYEPKVPYGSIGDEQVVTGKTKDYRAQLEASHEWGRFRFEGIAGAEQHLQDMRIHAERTYGLSEGVAPPTIELTQPFTTNPYGSADYIPSGYAKWDSANHFRGFYFYGSLTYLHKYSLSASARSEQSNRFAQNINRRALPMYSIGGSWQINDVFTARGNYGLTGITDYNSLPFTSITRAAAAYPLYTIISPGNELLQWEGQYMFSTGLDFSLKKLSLHGSVDFFYRQSRHVLLQQDGNTVSGYTRIMDNSGSVYGRGLELFLETRSIPIGHWWRWQAMLSYSRQRNTLQSAKGHNWPGWSYSNAGSWTPRPGHPVDAIYAYPATTLDPADGSPRGLLLGQPSKAYAAILADTSEGATVCAGSGTPQSFGSLRQSVSYKGFYLEAVFTYKGNYVYRKAALSYYSMSQQQSGGTPDFGQRWQQPGDEARTQIPSAPAAPDKARDDFFANSSTNVIRADHLRCQYITVGLRCSPQDKHFPSFLKGIKGAGISISLYNAGIVWRINRDHIDPDVPAGGWPAARTYQLSIHINW